MTARTIYADTAAGRLGATVDADTGRAMVHKSGGGMLGWFNLERFDGGKVTPASMRALFGEPTPAAGDDATPAPRTLAPYRIGTDYYADKSGAGKVRARSRGPVRSRTLSQSWDPAMSRAENHRRAAAALAVKHNPAATIPADPVSSGPGAFDWAVEVPA